MDKSKVRKQSKKDIELLEKMRKRFTLMLEADDENRRDALYDIKFAYEEGFQWDENMLKERGQRPTYTFNKIRVTCKRIINEQRANRAQSKIRPVEGGDKETAEIFEGLCRNIENISDFETISDQAAEYQVAGGYGAWRVSYDYADDNVFEQDIQIDLIPNPFTLFSDPSSRDVLKRDARDWILTEKMPREVYEEQYGDSQQLNEWESHEFDDDEEWQDRDEVRLAEYWYKEPTTKEIWQLSDGTVIDGGSDEAAAIQLGIDKGELPPDTIVKQRTVNTHKIMNILASGDAILEGPTEWAGKFFPFIPAYGEYMIIDGEITWYGAVRFARDAQKSYNMARTSITETIAQQPQSKYWVTAEQAKGHTEKWKEAHDKNFPFLLFNPDPKNPGVPQRMGTADIPTALITESQIASDEINMVTGIYQSDVGAANSASSGKQEAIRGQQGAIATYNYQDNMSKAKQRTIEILIDLIPHIYDTERELRIIGSDGAEDYKTVNKFVRGPNGEEIKLNDLSVGRYDTVVTTGPNFSTRRQEAAETYQQLLTGNPQIFPVIGDLIFKSMDLPYSEDIADRLKTMLPPEIQQTLNDGNEAQQSPEVMQAMQQAQQAMQMVEQQSQMVQEQAQEVQQEANQAEVAKSEVEKLIAKLETEQAKFEAKVAKEMAGIAQKDAKMTIDKLQNESEGIIEGSKQEGAAHMAQFQQALAQDVTEVLQSIQTIAAQLNEQAVASMAEITSGIENKPKVLKVVSQRVNGQLEAIPIYDDDDTVH